MNETIVKLNIAEIIPTDDNPRKKIDGPGFGDLMISIDEFGVTIPVIVRPHPTKKDKYDLRCGARRLEACKKLGLKEIPAIVREMSDTEAFDITFTENLAREDLTAAEMSDAVKTLLEKYTGSVETVAEKLNVTTKEVFMYVNVDKNLSPKWKSVDPHDFKIGHAALLARYPKEVQEHFLRTLNWRGLSTKALEKSLKGYNHSLASTLWVDSCKLCATRSDTLKQTALWDDGKGAPAICLNPACWSKKANAYFKEKLAKMPKPRIIGRCAELHYEATQGAEQIWEHDDSVKPCDEKTEGAFPVLCLNPGRNFGEMLYFKKKIRKAEKGRDEDSIPQKPKVDAKALLHGRRALHLINAVKEQLEKKSMNLKIFMDKYGMSGLLRLACEVGTEIREEQSDPQVWKDVEKGTAEDNAQDLLDSIRPVLAKRIRWAGPITQVPKEILAEAGYLAPLVGLEVIKLLDEAQKAYPDKTPKKDAKDA